MYSNHSPAASLSINQQEHNHLGLIISADSTRPKAVLDQLLPGKQYVLSSPGKI